MEIAIIAFLYLFVIIFNFIPTIKRRQKNEIWVHSIFLSVSLFLLVAKTINASFPTLSDFIALITEKFVNIK